MWVFSNLVFKNVEYFFNYEIIHSQLVAEVKKYVPMSVVTFIYGKKFQQKY